MILGIWPVKKVQCNTAEKKPSIQYLLRHTELSSFHPTYPSSLSNAIDDLQPHQFATTTHVGMVEHALNITVEGFAVIVLLDSKESTVRQVIHSIGVPQLCRGSKICACSSGDLCQQPM